MTKLTECRKPGAASEVSAILRLVRKQSCDYFRKIERSNYWTIQEDCSWKLFIPMGILWVDRNFIPLDAFVIAAIRPGFDCVGLNPALQLFCKEVVLIPVLLDSCVRQAR